MTAEERLDELTEDLVELAQIIANCNREDMHPGSETWVYVRGQVRIVAMALGRVWWAMRR